MSDPKYAGDIGWAVDKMRMGYKVRRPGWHKKGMFIVMMGRLQLPSFDTQATEKKVNDRTAQHIGKTVALDSQPYIAMCVEVDKKISVAHWQPGWVCSQADLLAVDWEEAT